jgi:1-acyl-sn-glycerol-3-phosphate acyltransferase
MGVFKRGAFMLADELQLSVVPLTINGSFNIKPRTRDMNWVTWHPLRLTIHKPIDPIGQGAENVKNIETESYRVIMADLVPEYQGYTENPDQK